MFCADKFEESKENKLEYTEVFDSYTTMVEKSLEDRLSMKISVSETSLDLTSLQQYRF